MINGIKACSLSAALLHPTATSKRDVAVGGQSASSDEKVSLSSQAQALAAADQASAAKGGYTRDGGPASYPPGYPADLKARLNKLFDDPSISDGAKNSVYANMVWSPDLGSKYPDQFPNEPDIYAKNFDAQAFIDQMIKAFDASGQTDASRALGTIR